MRGATSGVATVPARCDGHAERESARRCVRCGANMCSECDRFRADGSPCCARCAYAIDRSQSGRGSLAVGFAGLSLGVLAWMRTRYLHDEGDASWVVVAGALACVIAVAVWYSGRRGRTSHEVVLSARDPDEPPEPQRADPSSAARYRPGMRRLVSVATPRISGRSTALVVGLALLLSAAALPAALHLPRWVEIEGVLAAWWLVFFATSTWLLYRGFRLRDDLVYFTRWNKPDGAREPSEDHGPATFDGSGCAGVADGCEFGCIDSGEAGLVVVALGVAALAFFGGAWLLAEVAFPLLLLTGYHATLRILGRLARDHHGCRGELLRSLGWGALWASVYVAPLALVTWLTHLAAR